MAVAADSAPSDGVLPLGGCIALPGWRLGLGSDDDMDVGVMDRPGDDVINQSVTSANNQ